MLQAGFGIAAMIAAAWLLSVNRRHVPWPLVGIALSLQFVLALLLLRVAPIRDALFSLNHVVSAIEQATLAGSNFVFGYLGGGNPPFDVSEGSALFVFAFRVLPQILVFSVLVAVFWHWRILPIVVNGLSYALRRSLGVGGAVGLAAAGSIFLGMVEAPLMIRAYLQRLTRSEMFTVMTCGMSTVAGSVMILYTNVLAPIVANPLGQILTASVIAIPGAILMSRIMEPETEQPTVGDSDDTLQYSSTMDAVTRGTADGIRLVVNVAAMLIVLVSLVALLNHVLASLPTWQDLPPSLQLVLGWLFSPLAWLFGVPLNDVLAFPLSLQRVLGWLFAPLAWLMGVPWAECTSAGSLLGTKLVLNELVAYVEFAALGPDAFSARTDTILTFALCGFANFGSLGIMIGGLSAMAPERRDDILRLAPKSLISGTLVTCLSGAIVGVVY